MEIPRHWRLKAQRYRLEASVCASCGRLNFPPRPVCPYCAARPAVIAGWGPPVWPRPASSLDIKSPILYGITERIPG
jgi:hypothetical protein